KELESHAALSQCLVERRDDDVTHTRGHLPEKRALVLKEGNAGEEHGESGGKGRARVVTFFIAEHHVVHPTHKREVEYLSRSAVSQNPLPIIIIVDGSKTSRVGHQVVGDQPACSGNEQPKH